MSFTHLMSDSAPVTCSIACAHATAAAHVMNWPRSAANVGRSTMLRYKPVAAGEKNVFPGRPLPAICSSATTTVPSAAPSSARRRASAFVESTRLRTVTAKARLSGRNRSIPWGDNKSFSCESAYPLFVTASMAYPSARSASTAFHTALRLTPMALAMAAPDTWRSRLSSSKRSSCSLVPMGSMIGRDEEVVNEKCELG